MMTTERTAIRRRLAIRRTAHRPPWGARKAAASLHCGAAGRHARGDGRGRASAWPSRRPAASAARRAVARESRSSRCCLASGSRTGVQRMALGQVDLAIELLGGDGAVPWTSTRCTRRARRSSACARCCGCSSDELGEQRLRARERRAARHRRAPGRSARRRGDAGHARRADRAPPAQARRAAAACAQLRGRLAAEHERMERMTLGDPALRARGARRAARVPRARRRRGSLPDAQRASQLVEPGLQRIYRQGRRRYRRVARGKGDQARGDARVAQTRQGPALRRGNAPAPRRPRARARAGDARQARQGQRRQRAAGTPSGCARWPAARTSSANCSARTTTWRPARASAVRGRARARSGRERVGRGTRKLAAEADRRRRRRAAQARAARGRAPVRAAARSSFMRRVRMPPTRAATPSQLTLSDGQRALALGQRHGDLLARRAPEQRDRDR